MKNKETTLIRLCEKFFDLVEKDDDEWFKNMYAESSMRKDELAQCYYEYINQKLGGKSYFSDRRGNPNLISFHAQVGISYQCYNKWLSLMEDAIDHLDDVINSNMKASLMIFFTHICSTYMIATNVMTSHETSPIYDELPINQPPNTTAPKEIVVSSSDHITRHTGHKK